MLAVAMITPLVVMAQNKESTPEIVIDDATCAQRVGLLNYRSQLLLSYKDTEAQQYATYRKKWSTRVAYAGQWVKQDAEAARSKLYEMDRFHKVFISEIDKQIDDYRPLETAPLSCAPEQRDEVIKKLTEVQGLDGKKAVGGHALIQEKKKAFVQARKNTFEPASKELVERLHAAKKKTPNPDAQQIEVINY